MCPPLGPALPPSDTVPPRACQIGRHRRSSNRQFLLSGDKNRSGRFPLGNGGKAAVTTWQSRDPRRRTHSFIASIREAFAHTLTHSRTYPWRGRLDCRTPPSPPHPFGTSRRTRTETAPVRETCATAQKSPPKRDRPTSVGFTN
ncbi:hypothetical protein MTP99_016212 [Tenebrio molitor]|nr:hypothetical protein MTP99_016212 [Tenebrio molitor]